MKVLKKIVIGIAVLVIGLLAGSLLLPSKWSLERSIVIDAPVSKIYPLVASVKNGWPQWSPFMKADPEITIEYSGPNLGKGAASAWKSKKMGNGTSLITAADPKKGVEIEIKMEMSKTADHGAITFTPEGTSTRVTWTDAGDMGMNPGGRWFAFLFMDKMLGKMFEDGLIAMKAKAEGK